MAMKAMVVYFTSLQLLAVMFFLCNEHSVTADYPDLTANDPVDDCPIPPGMHNDQWNASYVPEPHAGGLCKNFNFPNTQRWSWRCQSTYCCGLPCNCNASVLEYPNDCNNVQLRICYNVVFSINNYKYECCSGFHEDANKVCVRNDPCINNTLRCQFQCLTENGVSQCTCPPGLVLNPADTTNTTCIESTTTAVTTSVAVTTSILPQSLPSQTETFPAQYVAAVVVGGVVFVGLLVGLAIYFCRPHPEIVPAVVVIGEDIKKKIDVDDDKNIVVVGKKQMEDYDVIDEKKKDPLYETIKDTGRRHQNSINSPTQQQQQQQPEPNAVDLASGGRKAQPNIYSSLSGRTPAVRPGINELSSSGTVENSSVTPVRFVVSDNSSDYAEIVAEHDSVTRI